MEAQFNISLKWIVITVIAVVMLFGGSFGWLGNKLNNTNQRLQEQKNLTEALNDTISYTLNKYDEEVAEKKTLQTSLDGLKELNINLSKNQTELISRIKGLEKDNVIISAALVKTVAKLDSALFDDVVVDDMKKTLTFTEVNDSISFNITINNAIPSFFGTKPSIMFNTLKIPNSQFVNFHWENDKEYKQKPVSFSITNSNPLFTTTNIESYAIPEVNKTVLKPTGMQKVGRFFKNRKSDLMIGIIATSVGILVGVSKF